MIGSEIPGGGILTIAIEARVEGGNPFYRASLVGCQGPWRSTPMTAIRDMFFKMNWWELANAIGISPVLDDKTTGVCSCGVPLLKGQATCPTCPAVPPS